MRGCGDVAQPDREQASDDGHADIPLARAISSLRTRLSVCKLIGEKVV